LVDFVKSEGGQLLLLGTELAIVIGESGLNKTFRIVIWRLENTGQRAWRKRGDMETDCQSMKDRIFGGPLSDTKMFPKWRSVCQMAGWRNC
jgi:hypothetical protein